MYRKNVATKETKYDAELPRPAPIVKLVSILTVIGVALTPNELNKAQYK